MLLLSQIAWYMVYIMSCLNCSPFTSAQALRRHSLVTHSPQSTTTMLALGRPLYAAL